MGGEQLGGAALLVSLAAARAGMPTAPVAVVGDDLAQLPETVALDGLDWSALDVFPGASAAFDLEYDAEGHLLSVVTEYGVASRGTAHALRHIADRPQDAYHLCCRRPLDVSVLLEALASRPVRFTVDFFLPSAQELIPRSVPWLARATAVFVNQAEYLLLTEALDVSVLPELVITDGPRAARVLLYGALTATSLPPTVVEGEVTGAGDTLTGTYLAHRLVGADPGRALDAGVIAATTHVRSRPVLDSPEGASDVLRRPPALRRP
ncbi:carbohydrate kinase family protein [Streptomyces sp. NPDC049906]|uniref:carbohydrate kinase family protein n=1 Tax=Streptomyces sp. NPDC049906 TaxID=3155656 RepID=UPI0034383ADC